MNRSRRLIGLVVLTAGLAFPLGVVASHQFSDVADTSPYHGDIDALADSGVTTGCGGGKYCPKDFVTREQMAAFLNRLGALGAGKTPVVNATRLDGKDSSDFLSVGTIVIDQHGPWLETTNSPLVLEYNLAGTTVELGEAGVGEVQVSLHGPGSIGGNPYDFQSAEICWGSSVNATINQTVVVQSETSEFYPVLNDATDHPLVGNGCYTVTDPDPHTPAGGTVLGLTIQYSAAGVATIGNVTTTWVSAD
jgi:hypothetical protein